MTLSDDVNPTTVLIENEKTKKKHILFLKLIVKRYYAIDMCVYFIRKNISMMCGYVCMWSQCSCNNLMP